MAKNSKKVKKYYVVERGRHKGFFDNGFAFIWNIYGCLFDDNLFGLSNKVYQRT